MFPSFIVWSVINPKGFCNCMKFSIMIVVQFLLYRICYLGDYKKSMVSFIMVLNIFIRHCKEVESCILDQVRVCHYSSLDSPNSVSAVSSGALDSTYLTRLVDYGSPSSLAQTWPWFVLNVNSMIMKFQYERSA